MISSTQYAAGPRNSAFPRLSRPIAFGAAAVAAAAVALTGCSKASTGAAASSGALNQIKLAADTSRDVNSLTANITVHSVGTTAGGLTGTIQMQLKPTTLIEARFDVPATTSPGIHLDEILTGQAIYFKNPAFTKTKAGKPWVKAKISELSSKSGLSFGSHPVSFHVWVDAQHLIKKADDTASVRGQTVTTTFAVTSVNQPVKVTLPKAGET